MCCDYSDDCAATGGPKFFYLDGSVAFFKSGESNPTQPNPHSPRGERQGTGGAAGGRLQVPQAPAGSPGGLYRGGGGGALSPPPPLPPPSSSQGLSDIFGSISRQLTMAPAGAPVPGLGTGRPPQG